MKYDLEADWTLLGTCNYRCGYCFLSPETLGAKLRTFASPENWKRAFDATGYTWLIHMTGGEPSLYPGFVDLCAGLTERHFISVNSNLTHASIESFAKRIKPARTSFINAGLHLEERDRRMQINGRRVLELADLLFDLRHDLRMAMADRDADDAGEAVEVLLAALVPQVLHVAFDHEQRILVVGNEAGRQILTTQGEHFVA